MVARTVPTTGKDMLVYLDDLLMFADTVEELLDILERNLHILARAGLKCKPRKCKLFCESIHYLGYVISPEGIAPEQEKINKIRAWPFPLTGIGMLSFLGLVGYYRKFVPDIGALASPLYNAAKEKLLLQLRN